MQDADIADTDSETLVEQVARIGRFQHQEARKEALRFALELFEVGDEI